jgi:hypothetical protein
MKKNPLAEVFGFPTSSQSKEAKRYRKLRLCPYNNNNPNCTKDKAKAPLGVCSVHYNEYVTIVCPVRFRQDWLVAEDAARFFFPESATWTSLTEVCLKDKHGKDAGNIDVVLVSYDDKGQILDFGALEVQAVYISGNLRQPFEHYMKEQSKPLDWSGHDLYPRPDYLSSSRKRLVPQLLYKGSILNTWRKKLAVAVDTHLYNTLPTLPMVSPEKADVAWLIYDLAYDPSSDRFRLTLKETVYTQFKPVLDKITLAEPGPMKDFIEQLQDKLEEKLDSNPPDAPPAGLTLT